MKSPLPASFAKPAVAAKSMARLSSSKMSRDGRVSVSGPQPVVPPPALQIEDLALARRLVTYDRRMSAVNACQRAPGPLEPAWQWR